MPATAQSQAVRGFTHQRVRKLPIPQHVFDNLLWHTDPQKAQSTVYVVFCYQQFRAYCTSRAYQHQACTVQCRSITSKCVSDSIFPLSVERQGINTQSSHSTRARRLKASVTHVDPSQVIPLFAVSLLSVSAEPARSRPDRVTASQQCPLTQHDTQINRSLYQLHSFIAESNAQNRSRPCLSF